MNNEKKVQVSKFKDTPIYFDEHKGFFCKFLNEYYHNEGLEELKQMLAEASVNSFTGKFFVKNYKGIIEFEAQRKYIDAYSGETTIIGVEIDEYGKKQGERKEELELYPDNKENRALFDEGKNLKAEGWSLIHQGERLADKLIK